MGLGFGNIGKAMGNISSLPSKGFDVSSNVLQYLTAAEEKKASSNKGLEEVFKPVVKELKSIGQTMKSVEVSLKGIGENIGRVAEAYISNQSSMENVMANANGNVLEIDIIANESSEEFMGSLANITENSQAFSGVITDFIRLSNTLNNDMGGDNLTQVTDGLNKLSEKSQQTEESSKGSVLGLMALVGGIGLFALAIGALSMVLTPTVILAFGGIVLGIKALSWAVEGMSEDKGKGLMYAASGIGVLAGAIFLLDNLVTVGGLLKFGLTVGVFGLAMGVLANNMGGEHALSVGKSILMVAGAIGLLAISLMLYEVVSLGSVLKMGMAVGIIGLTIYSLSSIDILRPTLGILMMTGAIAALAYVLPMYDNVSIGAIGALGASLGIIALATFLIGKGGMTMVAGLFIMAGMAGVLLLMNYALTEISASNLDFEKLTYTGMAVAGFGVVMAGLGLAIAPLFAGVIAVGLISGGLYVLGKALQELSKVDISEEQGLRFKDSIGFLAEGLLLMGDKIGVSGAVKAAAIGVPLAAAIYPLAESMGALGRHKMPNKKKVELFSDAVVGIGDTFKQFGYFDVPKLVAVMPAMIAMGKGTVTMAEGIKAFSEVSSNPDVVQQSVDSIDKFVTSFAANMTKYEVSDFERMKSGISSLTGIGNMMSDLADGVSKIGNMQFNTYKVKNGKLVLTDTRTFLPDDFKKVGKSIANILNAITEPLAIIGRQGSGGSFSMFGVEVFSFESNDVQNGINALSGIGGVFNPIVNAVDVFAKHQIDETKAKAFTKVLATVLGGMTQSFANIAADGETDLSTALMFAQGSSTFLKTLGEGDLEKTGVAVNSIADGIVKLKDAILELELDKLIKLNEIIFNSTHFEDANINAMMLLIEKINELMGTVSQGATQTVVADTPAEAPSGESPEIQQVATPPDMGGVTDVLDDIRDILSGVIRVGVVDSI